VPGSMPTSWRTGISRGPNASSCSRESQISLTRRFPSARKHTCKSIPSGGKSPSSWRRRIVSSYCSVVVSDVGAKRIRMLRRAFLSRGHFDTSRTRHTREAGERDSSVRRSCARACACSGREAEPIERQPRPPTKEAAGRARTAASAVSHRAAARPIYSAAKLLSVQRGNGCQAGSLTPSARADLTFTRRFAPAPDRGGTYRSGFRLTVR